MKHHMKAIHNQTHPYMCMSCNVFYKTKNQLVVHLEESKKCKDFSKKFEDNEEDSSEASTLSKLRILLAAVFKKISKPQLLLDLGFNRRLIDNVLKDSLETTKQPYVLDDELSDLDCLRLNTMTFLSWVVPAPKMKILRQKNTSPENILEHILNPSKMLAQNEQNISSVSSSPEIVKEKTDEIEILDSDQFTVTDTEEEEDDDDYEYEEELSTHEF